ncbi:MAG: YdiY family protein [Gemmatimonadota bacterium]
MRNAIVAAAAGILLIGSAAPAAEPPAKPAAALSDQAELSYVQTTGNTKTQTLAAKNLLSYRFTGSTTGSWSLSALRGEDQGRTTAESYATELRLDHLLTERVYVYGMAGWNKNRFAGLDQRYYGGAGAGDKLLAGPRHVLLAEAGLNETREEFTDNTAKTFLTGRAFAKYEYAFTPKSRCSQSLEYLHDFSDSKHYKLVSETAVTAAVTDVLSLKVGYTVRYDHQPIPAALRKTDTVLAAALVVNI